MHSLFNVIKRPVLTEKSSFAQEASAGKGSIYCFEVDVKANRLEIKAAVEKFFGVNVSRVNTQIVHGEWKRFAKGGRMKKPNWKKALVWVKPGQRIDVFHSA